MSLLLGIHFVSHAIIFYSNTTLSTVKQQKKKYNIKFNPISGKLFVQKALYSWKQKH